jgi:hypothetical protein
MDCYPSSATAFVNLARSACMYQSVSPVPLFLIYSVSCWRLSTPWCWLDLQQHISPVLAIDEIEALVGWAVMT